MVMRRNWTMGSKMTKLAIITWSGQEAPTIGLPKVSQSAPRKAESWKNVESWKRKAES